jgi:hypothetical protein
MISDFLVFPIVIFNIIIIKLGLTRIGKNNSVIFLTTFFLLTHLCLTTLSYFQLYYLKDSYITRRETSVFAAVISALAATVTYVLISYIPILKNLFFILAWLPYSKYWLDAFIVALPAFISHFISGKIITDLLS